MEFKDVAAVAGKSGLFQILKPTRTGVVLESLDSLKTKLIVNTNTKVSILKDITVYTTDSENMLLEDILIAIHTKYNGVLPLTSKSSDKELKDFLFSIVPSYDSERVYGSDIKKMVNWYGILSQSFPEVFVKKAEDQPTDSTTEKVAAKVGAEKPSAKAKKASAVKTPSIPGKVAPQNAASKKTTVARKAQ